jgi:ABC-type transport system substrate-binding protein
MDYCSTEPLPKGWCECPLTSVSQASLSSVVPERATSWSWNEDGTELTLPLRQGVRWHDGQSFTAQDVQCTWDLLTGKSSDKLRVNARKAWYSNLDRVTTNGDYQIIFHLKRSQPAFLAFLASGYSPVYPCHVSARDMRTHPIGTGPFKFVSFSPNEGSLHESALSVRHLGRSMNGLRAGMSAPRLMAALGWRRESRL